MKNRLLYSQALVALTLGFSGAFYIQAGSIGIIDWNTVLSSSLANNEKEEDIIATLQQTPKKGDGLQNKPNEKRLNLKYQDPETGLTLAGKAYIKGKNYKMLLQEIRSTSGCPMMRFGNNKEAEKWSKESIVDPKGCAYGGTGIHKHVKN
jgi:hypothetical protein